MARAARASSSAGWLNLASGLVDPASRLADLASGRRIPMKWRSGRGGSLPVDGLGRPVHGLSVFCSFYLINTSVKHFFPPRLMIFVVVVGARESKQDRMSRHVVYGGLGDKLSA